MAKDRLKFGRLRVVLVATSLALAGVLSVASQAGAAIQLGAVLSAPGSLALAPNTTALQSHTQKKVAPETYWYCCDVEVYGSSAIITSWSTYGGGGTYQLKLKVGTAASTDEGIVRYESAMETVSGPGLHVFPARIRIFGGEGIGAYTPTGAPGFLQAMPEPCCHIVILKAGDQLEPPGKAFGPWDGWTNPADFHKQSYRMNLAATVEPDVDGDGFGDESQDKCVGVKGDADGCVPPPPPPLRCKKGFKKTLTAKGTPRCKKVKSKGAGKKKSCRKKKGKGKKGHASASRKKHKGKGKKRCGAKKGKGKKKGNGHGR